MQEADIGRVVHSINVMKIEDLLVREMVTAAPDEAAIDLREKMSNHRVHALPVVDELGVVLGIVTSSDLEDDVPDETPVGEIMSEEVYEIHPEDDAREAAKLMREEGTHHLIVTEAKRAVGVLSSFDLLRVIVES